MYALLAFVAIIIMCLICLAYDSILGVPSTDILVILVLTLVLSKLLKKIRHKPPKKPFKKHALICTDPPASISPEDIEFDSHCSGIQQVSVSDSIYVIVGRRRCYNKKCRVETPVVAFALDDFVETRFNAHHKGSLVVAKDVYPLPPKLKQHLKDYYNYRVHVDDFTGEIYGLNYCVNCNGKHGNYYLHEEDYDAETGEGIFAFLNDAADVLVYYSIKLPCEVLLSCNFNGSGEHDLPPKNKILEGRLQWE